jgi:hypothetical protein
MPADLDAPPDHGDRPDQPYDSEERLVAQTTQVQAVR